ncbi:hypothetical protein AB0K48_00200 [Nonomuraea sp. NPDC055795]
MVKNWTALMAFCQNSAILSTGGGEVIMSVADELGRLQRGRGVMASDLLQRMGPTLRELTGISESDSQNEARVRLVKFLTDLANDLPPDLSDALSAGLALRNDVRHRFLEGRMKWLATRIDRDVSTARRRVKEANQRAEEIVAAMKLRDDVYAPSGWYLARIKTVLRLDILRPTAVEERTVVSSYDDLDEILISTNVPRPGTGDEPHGVDLDVAYGGRLVRQERLTDTYFRYFIRLPRPLRLGEAHDVCVTFTLPEGQRMRPRYTFQPLRRCDEFSLRIRFDQNNPPDDVWRIDGLPQSMADDFAGPEARLIPDKAAEVQLAFRDLRIGMAYGARWDGA